MNYRVLIGLLLLGSTAIHPMMDSSSKKSDSSYNPMDLLLKIVQLPEDQKTVAMGILTGTANEPMMKKLLDTEEAKAQAEQAEFETRQEELKTQQVKEREESKRLFAGLKVRKEEAKAQTVIETAKKEREKAETDAFLEKNRQENRLETIAVTNQLDRNRDIDRVETEKKNKIESQDREERLKQLAEARRRQENDRLLGAQATENAQSRRLKQQQHDKQLQEQQQKHRDEMAQKEGFYEREKAERIQAINDKERSEAAIRQENERSAAQIRKEEEDRTRRELEAREAMEGRLQEEKYKKKLETERERQKTVEMEGQQQREEALALQGQKMEDERRHYKDYKIREDDASIRRREEKHSELRQKIDAFFNFVDHPEHMKKTLTYVGGTVVSVAGGVYFFKHAMPIVRKKVEEILFTPPLVDETSFEFTLPWKKKTIDQKLDTLYFNPELKGQIERVHSVLKNTKKHGGYFLNYLFYGEPGTGKTASARALAYESGLDYAIMSGGNVQKLLNTGKAEERIKQVFNWAKKSKKGLLLFIDEADAFLKDPNNGHNMTEQLYAILNSFLNLTGTESKDICIILSTNHPQNLPKAVLDRVGPGQFIYFGIPKYEERVNIVKHFVGKYLESHNKPSKVDTDGDSDPITPRIDDETIQYIAQKTDGFSGRNISYLILAIEKVMLTQETPGISRVLIDTIVEQAVKQHSLSLNFQSHA